MTIRTRTLIAALMGTLALTTSAATLADSGRWNDRGGPGWGHNEHERWHHQHRDYGYQSAPYGQLVIQTAPQVIYAPRAYYDDGYYYRAPSRYVYPVVPSFSFGMTIPLD